MKTPIKKELFLRFEHALNDRFPQFTAFDADRKSKTWSWKAGEHLRFFVMLQPLEQLEQFVVELAWSTTDEFPWGAIGRTDPAFDQGRERLGLLAIASGDEFLWDMAPEKTARQEDDLTAIRQGRSDTLPADAPLRELLPRVSALVQDALDKLETHGLPFLRRVADARGVAVPDRP